MEIACMFVMSTCKVTHDQSRRDSYPLILSLRLPPDANASVTVPLVKAIFTLVDTLDAKLNLRPETKSKLRKAREDLDERMRKELEAEKKEEVCGFISTRLLAQVYLTYVTRRSSPTSWLRSAKRRRNESPS